MRYVNSSSESSIRGITPRMLQLSMLNTLAGRLHQIREVCGQLGVQQELCVVLREIRDVQILVQPLTDYAGDPDLQGLLGPWLYLATSGVLVASGARILMGQRGHLEQRTSRGPTWPCPGVVFCRWADALRARRLAFAAERRPPASEHSRTRVLSPIPTTGELWTISAIWRVS